MKEVIFNRKDYKNYKEFYEDVFNKLDGKNNIDFKDMPDLLYSGDVLNEFLWYNHDKSIKYIFVGFDLEKIKEEKTLDDCHYVIIFRVFSRFVNEYPNNSVEFRSE